jgi:chb protein
MPNYKLTLDSLALSLPKDDKGYIGVTVTKDEQPVTDFTNLTLQLVDSTGKVISSAFSDDTGDTIPDVLVVDGTAEISPTETYKVKLTSSVEGEDNATAESDPVTITVAEPGETPALKAIITKTVSGTTVVLRATVESRFEDKTFTWYKNGEEIELSKDKAELVLEAGREGSYTVKAQADIRRNKARRSITSEAVTVEASDFTTAAAPVNSEDHGGNHATETHTETHAGGQPAAGNPEGQPAPVTPVAPQPKALPVYDHAENYAMIDIARKKYTVAAIKRFVENAKRAGYRGAILHIGDNETFAVKLTALGDYNDKVGAYLTKEEVKGIVDAYQDAKFSVGLKVGMPSHAAALLRYFNGTNPSVVGGRSHLKQTKEAANALAPILTELLSTSVTVFHAGGDEIEGYDKIGLIQFFKSIRDTLRSVESFGQQGKIFIWNDAVVVDNVKEISEFVDGFFFWQHKADRATLAEIMATGKPVFNANSYYCYNAPTGDKDKYKGDANWAARDALKNWSLNQFSDNSRDHTVENAKNVAGVVMALWSERSGDLSGEEIVNRVNPFMRSIAMKADAVYSEDAAAKVADMIANDFSNYGKIDTIEITALGIDTALSAMDEPVDSPRGLTSLPEEKPAVEENHPAQPTDPAATGNQNGGHEAQPPHAGDTHAEQPSTGDAHADQPVAPPSEDAHTSQPVVPPSNEDSHAGDTEHKPAGEDTTHTGEDANTVSPTPGHEDTGHHDSSENTDHAGTGSEDNSHTADPAPVVPGNTDGDTTVTPPSGNEGQPVVPSTGETTVVTPADPTPANSQPEAPVNNDAHSEQPAPVVPADPAPVTPAEPAPVQPAAPTPGNNTEGTFSIELSQTNLGDITEGETLEIHAVTQSGATLTSCQWYQIKEGIAVAIDGQNTDTLNIVISPEHGKQFYLSAIVNGSQLTSKTAVISNLRYKDITIESSQEDRIKDLKVDGELNVTAVVTPNDSNLTLKWEREVSGVRVPVVGNTTSSLYISPLALTDAGNYYLVATRFDKKVEKLITQVTVTDKEVLQPMAVTLDLSGNVQRPFGGSFQLVATVTNLGENTVYQWFRTPNGGQPALLPAQQLSVLSIADLKASDAGHYYVEVSDGVRQPVRSASVYLDVIPEPKVENNPGANAGNNHVNPNDPHADSGRDYTFTNLKVYNFRQYANVMQPVNRTPPAVGLSWQIRLYGDLMDILKYPDVDVYMDAMDAAVDFFYTYKDSLFSMDNRARFLQYATDADLTKDDREALLEVFNVFASMGDPETNQRWSLFEIKDILQDTVAYARLVQYYDRKFQSMKSAKVQGNFLV